MTTDSVTEMFASCEVVCVRQTGAMVADHWTEVELAVLGCGVLPGGQTTVSVCFNTDLTWEVKCGKWSFVNPDPAFSSGKLPTSSLQLARTSRHTARVATAKLNT